MTHHESWRLLPTSSGDAANELASAEALLVGLGHTPTSALRWYTSAQPALILGSGQKRSDIDHAACARAGVSLHRRASGGSAVLFVPGLLMQDIALPSGHPLAIADVSESYRWLGEAWAATLERLRIPATPIAVAAAREDTQRLDPLLRPVCFAGRSPYEILSYGRKLVGFSQVRRRQGILLQVGLYTHWPGSLLANLLTETTGTRIDLVTALASRVTGLAELPVPTPDHRSIMAHFASIMAHQHGVYLQPAVWRDDEQATIQAVGARYSPINP